MATEYMHAADDLDVGSQRLRRLERLHDGFSTIELAATGVDAGWDCLEVGAGAGSIARWLLDRVSPSGSVTAIDLQTSYLADLAARPNASVIEASVVDAEFAPGSFDLIHARLVLTHIAERDQVLSSLVEWLRPGGWLVLEEAAHPSVHERLDPTDERAVAFEVLMDRIVEFVGGFSDHHYGRRLLPEFHRRGLTDLAGAGFCPLIVGGSEAAEFYRISADGFLPRMVAEGKLSHQEYELLMAALADPGFVTHGTPAYSARGRKPS